MAERRGAVEGVEVKGLKVCGCEGGKLSKKIKNVRDLEVYKLAFEAAMKIFQLTKSFPADEKYSLVDQIRRSSRSVCSNLAEAWRKRRYPAVFKNKLTDAMQEASETQTWLEFCKACDYMDLNTMDMKADSFCFSSSK